MDPKHMCRDLLGEGCCEKRIQRERLGQPPNLGKVENDRTSSGIDPEIVDAHVGLGEHQRFAGDADVGDGWAPQADNCGSLAGRLGTSAQGSRLDAGQANRPCLSNALEHRG